MWSSLFLKSIRLESIDGHRPLRQSNTPGALCAVSREQITCQLQGKQSRRTLMAALIRIKIRSVYEWRIHKSRECRQRSQNIEWFLHSRSWRCICDSLRRTEKIQNLVLYRTVRYIITVSSHMFYFRVLKISILSPFFDVFQRCHTK